MPLAKVDDRDTILLKKINLGALLEDAIEKAESVDPDRLERGIEEERNQLEYDKMLNE